MFGNCPADLVPRFVTGAGDLHLRFGERNRLLDSAEEM